MMQTIYAPNAPITYMHSDVVFIPWFEISRNIDMYSWYEYGQYDHGNTDIANTT